MIEERYEIIKLLGKGRTGGVYEAEDSNLGRKVALRRFFAQGKQIELADYKEDFESVTHALSALQHPNLLRVYDAGVDDDGAFIISQLLKGETLHDRTKEGPIPIKEVYDLAMQLLDALSTAHIKGFVHGAITPGSILMTSRARGGYLYVILDLGLSRLAPLIQGKDSILSIMADPAILAPELFDGGIGTERADLYMLGHIIYMSLAGGHPFGGVSIEEAEKMHQAGLPPLEEYNPDVPEDFRLWIEKLTQIDPNKRPESAVEALNTLPKLKRAAQQPTTGIHPVAPQLNPGIAPAPNPQSPSSGVAGADATAPPPLSSGGPPSGIMPVSPTATHPAVPGAGLVLQPTSSKKPLVIVLVAVALVALIIIIMVSSGSGDVAKNSNSKDTKFEKGTAPYRAPDNSGKSYAERNAIDEKIIITHFDGSKPPANNKSWKYVSKDMQGVTDEKDAWRIKNLDPTRIMGIAFSLKSSEYDMYDFGWKLTYKVRPIKGSHRFGVNFDEKVNPGWKSGKVSCILQVKHLADGNIELAAMASETKAKTGKSIKVPYCGDNGWHTIVVEQKREAESGAYTVSIDNKPAFSDTFTQGVAFGNLNQLLSTLVSADEGGDWAIKEMKLETP